MNGILPPGLIEQILKGNYELFLGTGFGQMNVSRIDEQGLITELIKFCDYEVEKLPEAFRVTSRLSRPLLLQKEGNACRKTRHLHLKNLDRPKQPTNANRLPKPFVHLLVYQE